MALAVDSARHLVYIANWGAYKSNGEDMTYLGALPTNMVTVMEEDSGKVVNSYPIGNTSLGDSLGIAVDSGRQRVYVTNRSDATLSIIDTARRTVSAVAVGSGPMGVAVDPGTGQVYVANHADKTVTVLDASGKTLGIVPVDGNPAGVAVDGTTHQAYVALDRPPALAVLSGTTRLTEVGLGNLTLTSVGAVAVDPGLRVYVHIGSGAVAMFDTSGGAPQYMGSFSADSQYADGVAVDTTYHLVYVSATLSGQVNVFTGDGTPVYTLSAGRSPTGIAIDPLARRGFVANTFSNSVTTIDLASRTVTPGSSANTSVPSGMAFDSSSRRLFLGNWEADSLTVMDADAKTIKANWPTQAHKPWAVALDAGLQQAYVLNAGDGGTFSIMDMNDGTVKALIGFPQPNPGGDNARNGSVAVSPSTHKVYVATGTDSLDTVLIIDGQARTVIQALSVGDTRVSGVAVDDNQGIAYVLSNYSGLITLVSVMSDQIVDQWQIMDAMNPDIPNRGWLVAADPGRSRIYITVPHMLGSFTGVVAIDTAQVVELWRTAVPDYTSANAVMMNPATGHVCYTALNEIGPLDSVVCLQPDGGQVVQTVPVGRHADILTGTLAGFLAVDKDSSTVYVTNTVGGTVQIIGDN
jgi:YVTN family beta-propeller protein